MFVTARSLPQPREQPGLLLNEFAATNFQPADVVIMSLSSLAGKIAPAALISRLEYPYKMVLISRPRIRPVGGLRRGNLAQEHFVELITFTSGVSFLAKVSHTVNRARPVTGRNFRILNELARKISRTDKVATLLGAGKRKFGARLLC